ncbi:MAG TPA: response regulator [Syntrophorhabdaceae bacterium]|nr:response regulator [Syntrophorhabdaceae bacterium]
MSKILIVDDDPEIRKLLSIKLVKEGYEVVVAVDTYDAIQGVHGKRPDLVVLDIMLPAGGGLNVLKNIRSIPASAMTPVVVLTAIDDEEMRQKIEQAGVEAYIRKPFDYEVLSATIKDLLTKDASDAGKTSVVPGIHTGKVLIVDDDPDITKQLVSRLSHEGYDAFFAVDAYDATQSVRKKKPDLVVLDIMLPAGGGLQVLKNIRSMPVTAATPVVVLTAIDDEEMRQKIEQAGVEAYIRKPFDYEVLSATIKDLLTK